jgi:hypothetical protein
VVRFPHRSLSLAPLLLPEGDELAQAVDRLLLAGRAAEDLDEAEDRRQPTQEAQAGPLRFPSGIGLVPEVGLVGVGRDLVLRRGEAGRGQGTEADLLAELVERVAHTLHRHEPRASCAAT